MQVQLVSNVFSKFYPILDVWMPDNVRVIVVVDVRKVLIGALLVGVFLNESEVF